MIFTRFLACGDSFTEGMTDEMVDGQFRGWGDRVADVLATLTENFSYANFAIRGKLVHQVVKDQVPIALTYVTGPETLVSFHAGANDVLRPKYNPDVVLPLYTQAVRAIAKSGASILLFTVLERTDAKGKAADLWEARFRRFNENVRAVAKEVGAFIADANEDGLLADRRFLADDRLHLNPLGHDRVAQAVLEKLGAPFDSNWRTPLAPKQKISLVNKVKSDVKWWKIFLIPWIWRRLRGKSSGDGRSAKQSAPISWPAKI